MKMRMDDVNTQTQNVFWGLFFPLHSIQEHEYFYYFTTRRGMKKC
jgi:hypothetical protein